MDIRVDSEGSLAVIHCVGSLDASSIDAFKKATQGAIIDGTHHFIVNGEDLTFIDSMGLGVLISLMRRLKQHDGEIIMASLSPDVHSIFEITRLNRLFDICPTMAEAKQRFKE
jgi:anti-sigma B factor antagonist